MSIEGIDFEGQFSGLIEFNLEYYSKTSRLEMAARDDRLLRILGDPDGQPYDFIDLQIMLHDEYFLDPDDLTRLTGLPEEMGRIIDE